jgi:small conductance mechanosensitive channel
MNLRDISWSVVVLRGVQVLVIWLAIWLAQHLLIRRLGTIDRLFGRFQVSERDLHTLEWLINMVLVIIGLGITLSILKVMPLLLTSAVIGRIVALALLWVVIWVLVRYLSQWIQALDKRTTDFEIDPRDLVTIDRLLDYSVILIGVIISLAILNLTSLLYSALTAAGIISVIIGFAVKDIAANFISGIFLLIDRPFVIGDAISIKEYTGVVNKISLRSTEIITYDGPVVTIPNSTMAVEPTTNYTLSQDRRVLFTVSVLNTANMNRVIKAIQAVLDAEERLLPDKTPSIMVGAIRDYAVDFQVAAYTRNEDFLQTQSDLQKEIVASFADQGIDLAVPLRMNLSPAQANLRT